MTTFVQKAVIVVALILSAISTHATHIVGGDLTYKFLQFNNNGTEATFQFDLNLYKDTSPTSNRLPSFAEFIVYRPGPNGGWIQQRRLNASRGVITEVPYIENPCREEPTYFVGVETAAYQATFNLPIINEDYLIVVTECCRNYTINNIVLVESTGKVGATYDVLITPEAQRLGNNSVIFNKYPPIFICTALPLREDVSGVDVEGDSLVYTLCDPLNDASGTCRSNCAPPFNNINFIPPYTAQAPMAGNPVVGVDPSTGIMFGTPEVSGQYVVGMCIEEYRNGILLSKIRRDFQFNSIACGEELHAIIDAKRKRVDSTTYDQPREIYEIDLCGYKDGSVKSASTGGTVIYTYDWRLRDVDNNLLVSEVGTDIDEMFASLPDLATYNGTLILNNGLDCPDTAYFEVNTYPGLAADFDFQMDSCFLASIQFTDNSYTDADMITDWDWKFGTESSSDLQNTIYKFDERGTKLVSLTITDNNGCEESATKIIKYEPLFDEDIPIEMEERTVCHGESVLFGGVYRDAEGFYLHRLTDDVTGCDTLELQLALKYYAEPEKFNDSRIICPGETISFFDQVVTEEGTYQHKIESKTVGVDCDSVIYTMEVEVHPEINASFSMAPLFDCFRGSYAITAAHETDKDNISSITWDLGDGTTKERNNFFHEYADRGDYIVNLYVEDVFGCRDTVTQNVEYNPPFEDPIREDQEIKVLCIGDSIFFDNRMIGASGTYRDKLKHAGTECDSVFREWKVEVQWPAKEFSIDTMKCPDEALLILGNSYSGPTDDEITIKASVSGCDSLIYYINVQDFEVPDIEFEDKVSRIPELADTPFPVIIPDEVVDLTWSPAEGLDCTDCFYPTINYATDTEYTVQSVTADGCMNTASAFVQFIEIPHYIPNAINSNAPDEVDRCFFVQKPDYALKTDYYDMDIFDRWGNLHFSGRDLLINSTSDCFLADKVEPGVYVYMIEIREPDETLKFAGNFTVIR